MVRETWKVEKMIKSGRKTKTQNEVKENSKKIREEKQTDKQIIIYYFDINISVPQVYVGKHGKRDRKKKFFPLKFIVFGNNYLGPRIVDLRKSEKALFLKLTGWWRDNNFLLIIQSGDSSTD